MTHGAVDVSFSPHHVVLLVDHLGPAQHVEVFHDIFLHISQRGDLGEESCQGRTSSGTDRKTGNWGAHTCHAFLASSEFLPLLFLFKP